MKTLVLLSDINFRKTKALNQQLKSLLGRSNLRMVFVPSKTTKNKKYENLTMDYYRWLGVREFVYFDLDSGFDESLFLEISSCGIIHLDGGNPHVLNENIFLRKFDVFLRDFLDNGGILIGVSAGALQFAPDLGIVQVIEGRQLAVVPTGLHLIDFDFAPHFKHPRFDYDIDELVDFAEKNGRPLYLCPDGAGIFVTEDSVQLVGEVEVIPK